MLVLRDMTMTGRTRRDVLFAGISLSIPQKARVALLGPNGAGKSTFLAGVGKCQKLRAGKVSWNGMFVSWPVGLGRFFNLDLTGAQNVTYIGEMNGLPVRDYGLAVRDFSELGAQFYEPVRTYSSGERARLAFSMALKIQYDFFLIDEVLAVGDAGFRAKSRAELERRLDHAGAIISTHSMGLARTFCDSGLVLRNGQMRYFPDIDDAIADHRSALVGDSAA